MHAWAYATSRAEWVRDEGARCVGDGSTVRQYHPRSVIWTLASLRNRNTFVSHLIMPLHRQRINSPTVKIYPKLIKYRDCFFWKRVIMRVKWLLYIVSLSVCLWTKIAKHRGQQQDMAEDRTAETQRPNLGSSQGRVKSDKKCHVGTFPPCHIKCLIHI